MTMKTQPISRRALAAGLVLAPVAGLPALAGVVSTIDPVLAALAEHHRAHAAWEAIENANATLGAASEPIGFVTYKGEKVYSLPHLNGLAGRPHYPLTAAELEETIERLRRGWAKQQEELASPPDSEFEAARVALEARQSAPDLAREKAGADEAEAASNEAFGVLGEAERAVYEAEPTSPAGAIALLRFAADFLEENGVNDTMLDDVFPDAIRAAADFFEGRA
jgi:hypothetical protein